MQPLCSDVFFSFGRCSRFPAPPALRASGAGVFFFFFREKKRDVLFFLFFQKKKRKNQRKETLSGRGMSGNNRTGRPPHTLSVFPCGAFQRKAPQNIFAGKASSADGREQRADPGGFLSFLFGSFSFTERKRTKKSPAKYFLRGRQVPLTGGRSGCFRGGFMAFALVLFSPPERKENEERERKRAKKARKTAPARGRAGAGRVCGGAIRNRPRYRSSST